MSIPGFTRTSNRYGSVILLRIYEIQAIYTGQSREFSLMLSLFRLFAILLHLMSLFQTENMILLSFVSVVLTFRNGLNAAVKTTNSIKGKLSPEISEYLDELSVELDEILGHSYPAQVFRLMKILLKFPLAIIDGHPLNLKRMTSSIKVKFGMEEAGTCVLMPANIPCRVNIEAIVCNTPFLDPNKIQIMV
jgi:hypothetical protein